MAAERDQLAEPVQHPVIDGRRVVRAERSRPMPGMKRSSKPNLPSFLRSPGSSGLVADRRSRHSTPTSAQTVTTDSDPVAMASGLSQLNKYLNKTWYRAGIPAQLHDDSTQAVYTALLQNMGRGRFDGLVSEVGNWGVRDTFTRETSDGLAFFRAVDMVKKRAQRERMHQSLDSVDVASEDRGSETGTSLRRGAQRSHRPYPESARGGSDSKIRSWARRRRKSPRSGESLPKPSATKKPGCCKSFV